MIDVTKESFIEFINNADSSENDRLAHLGLVQKDFFLRDTGSREHFCVYFAGVDVHAKKVFIGHHKKADLWLFNGGHVDLGETPTTAIFREAQEEWGVALSKENLLPFSYLTVTSINNPTKQPLCAAHYDLWHFIKLDVEKFAPNQTKLSKEFHQSGWYSVDDARSLAKDSNTLKIFEYLEKKLV